MESIIVTWENMQKVIVPWEMTEEKKTPCIIGKSQDIKNFYQWWNCKVTKKSQGLLIEDLPETDDKSSKRKCSLSTGRLASD